MRTENKIYKNVRGHVRTRQLRLRATVNELLGMKAVTFRDVVKLYVELSGILLDMGETDLYVLEGHIRTIEDEVFSKKEFDRMLIEKGSLMNNENILRNVMLKCASYVEGFLRQYLVEEPEWKYFKEFDIYDFTNLDKVFNNDYMDASEYLFTYKRNGKTVYVKDRKEYIKFTKDDMGHIWVSYEWDRGLAGYLNELSGYNFNLWKSYVLEAVESMYKGYDIMKNDEFMTRLGGDLKKAREVNVIREKEMLAEEIMKEDKENERKRRLAEANGFTTYEEMIESQKSESIEEGENEVTRQDMDEDKEIKLNKKNNKKR